jgi:lysophospholipase L1-like esterase
MWLGTALAILAGVELVLPRVAPPQHLSRHRWGNRPHTFLPGVAQRAVTANYDVAFRTNWLGYNDVEHALGKAPDRFRVLLLGDSFVEGMQVAPERHLARLLEGLAARDGRALEVVAMGISGYGQSHELATYEALGRAYAPDLVIAFFCPNDLWNNLVGVEGEEGPAIYRIDPDGTLVSNIAALPETPPTPGEYRKHERAPRFPGLRIARRLLRGSYRLAFGDARGAARAEALNELPKAKPGGDRRGPRGIRPDQQAMFEALVAEMERRIVERDGHPLLSVTVSGNLFRPSNRAYERMTSWVAEVFARHGVDNVALDPLFRERARREGRMPHWETDAHWNETGHAWVAEALYARLRPLLRGSVRTPATPAG